MTSGPHFRMCPIRVAFLERFSPDKRVPSSYGLAVMGERKLVIVAIWLGVILPLVFVSAMLLTAYQ